MANTLVLDDEDVVEIITALQVRMSDPGEPPAVRAQAASTLAKVGQQTHP